MYIYMYIYIYICVCVCVCTRTYLYIYIYSSIYLSIYIYILKLRRSPLIIDSCHRKDCGRWCDVGGSETQVVWIACGTPVPDPRTAKARGDLKPGSPGLRAARRLFVAEP